MKPNDRVRILGTSNDFLEQYIGSVGVVENYEEHTQSAQVRCVISKPLDGVWVFWEGNLEVVSNENY